jgi:hypothetical protein
MTGVETKNPYKSDRGKRGNAWKFTHCHAFYCYISIRGNLYDCSRLKKWRISAVAIPLAKAKGVAVSTTVPPHPLFQLLSIGSATQKNKERKNL